MSRRTAEELGEELCSYCVAEPGVKGTPNGYVSCEGAYCNEAYERYLEEDDE